MCRFEKFKMNLLMDSGTLPKREPKQTQNYYLLMKRKLDFSYCLFDLVQCKMEILRCIIKLHSNIFSNFKKSTLGIGL